MRLRETLFLYIAYIFKFAIFPGDQEESRFLRLYIEDLGVCPECFIHQRNTCLKMHREVEFVTRFGDSFDAMFGVRHSRRAYHDQAKIIVKYPGDAKQLEDARQARQTSRNEVDVIRKFRLLFFNPDRVGLLMCPPMKIDKFVHSFGGSPRISVWTHMVTDFQPLLLEMLNRKGFPVPNLIATCGLTMYQSYDGEPLISLINESFETKTQIAIQLLEGALQFSRGINGYRIYITDINMDNIVYDKSENRVSFVDLDKLIIVDSAEVPKVTHQHDPIPCEGCFAYAPMPLCTAHKSDFNLYAVCQMLRQDYYEDTTRGFLHPIPVEIREDFPELVKMLDLCVDCVFANNCTSRYDVVTKLLKEFKSTIGYL